MIYFILNIILVYRNDESIYCVAHDDVCSNETDLGDDNMWLRYITLKSADQPANWVSPYGKYYLIPSIDMIDVYYDIPCANDLSFSLIRINIWGKLVFFDAILN